MKVLDLSDGRWKLPKGTAIDLPWVDGEWEEVTPLNLAVEIEVGSPQQPLSGGSEHAAREAAEAMVRSWTGEPAPRRTDFAHSAEAKLQREISATIEMYGSWGTGPSAVVDDFGG